MSDRVQRFALSLLSLLSVFLCLKLTKATLETDGRCRFDESAYVKTFDGAVMNRFMGICRYLAARPAPCSEGIDWRPWSVEVQNQVVKFGNVRRASMRSMHILAHNHIVSLEPHHAIFIDRERVDRYEVPKTVSDPKTQELWFTISGQDNTIIVTLHTFGVTVYYRWNQFGKVPWGEIVLDTNIIQPTGSVCGLCGNFNGDPSDDYAPRNKNSTVSEAHALASWETDFDSCFFRYGHLAKRT